jgi:hypothetical protein
MTAAQHCEGHRTAPGNTLCAAAAAAAPARTLWLIRSSSWPPSASPIDDVAPDSDATSAPPDVAGISVGTAAAGVSRGAAGRTDLAATGLADGTGTGPRRAASPAVADALRSSLPGTLAERRSRGARPTPMASPSAIAEASAGEGPRRGAGRGMPSVASEARRMDAALRRRASESTPDRACADTCRTCRGRPA